MPGNIQYFIDLTKSLRMTLRHSLYFEKKGGIILGHRFYYTRQFAQKASVSVRTLRYYDKVGLLSPQQHTSSGYRLYTDEDLFCLQQILALKFLNFSLAEIKVCLQTGPEHLQEVLTMQKAMLFEKRMQLDTIIQAVEQTEKLLRSDQNNWEAIVSVIQVMHMEQQNNWHQKYFSAEQLQQMEALREKSYTEEQRQQLAEWGKGWSEEDQKRADQQWGAVNAELHRLVAEGDDVASPQAQAWAKSYCDLIDQFTHGDAGIAGGLKNFYQAVEQSPATERPIALPYNAQEAEFIQKVVALYRQEHQ
jgi:MerR family transcriptional regulator, thiopeptide resistance regulator